MYRIYILRIISSNHIISYQGLRCYFMQYFYVYINMNHEFVFCLRRKHFHLKSTKCITRKLVLKSCDDCLMIAASIMHYSRTQLNHIDLPIRILCYTPHIAMMYLLGIPRIRIYIRYQNIFIANRKQTNSVKISSICLLKQTTKMKLY